MKAAMRLGSVKVVKSSAADVRNSAVEDRGTVFMLGPFAWVELVVVFPLANA